MPKKEKVEPELVICEGKIYFKPIEARDLKGGKKLTPYCNVYQDKVKKFQTDVISKTHDPNWNESARLIILEENTAVEKIRFVVKHKGTVMDDYIGELSFKVTELLDGVPRDDWFSLKTKNGKKSMGELHLQIMYLDKGEDMTKDLEEFTAPLQTLLRKKSFKAWQTMIDQDFDIEKADSKGRTPLHVCAELNLKDNMQVLLKKNADVVAKDQAEQTALHLGAEAGSKECTGLLLEAGADINAKDKTAKTPLHLAAAKNKPETAIMLIEKGCAVSPQDENGDTPLHIALQTASLEMIDLLVQKGADIYLKNAKGKSCCDSSISIGDDEAKSEIVRKRFFKAINVVDEREFPLKQKYPHLAAVSGEGINPEESWWKDPQYIITGPKDAEVHLLLHYDDPISKVTVPMEKCGFLTFKNAQSDYKELTYWYDNVIYGRIEPTTILFNEDTDHYAVIAYSKMQRLNGKWWIIAYSTAPVQFAPLKDWPHSLNIQTKWEGETAGGCISHPTFPNNPKYILSFPPKITKTYIVVSQDKNLADVEKFSITSYKYYIGFYLYDSDLVVPIDMDPVHFTTKFKNTREAVLYFEVDGNKHQRLVFIPALFRPGETSNCKVLIASSEEIKAQQLDEIPKADSDEESPKVEKKKSKKKKN